MEPLIIRTLHIDNSMFESDARQVDELIQSAIDRFLENPRSKRTNIPSNPHEPLRVAFYDLKFERSFVNDLAQGHEILASEPHHIVISCASSGTVNSIKDIEESPGFRLLNETPRERTEVLLYTNGYFLVDSLGDQDIIASEIHGFFMETPISEDYAQEKFVQRVTRMLQNVLEKLEKSGLLKKG